jgi:long-chain acyl-CoA synthetase
MGLNLDDVFRATARTQPDRPAVLGPGPDAALTYAGLDDLIDAFAAKYAWAGVGPGACVGMHAPSGTAYIAATYAAWRCGACAVPVPAELSAPEKDRILRCVAIGFVVSPPRTAGFLAEYRAGPEVEAPAGLAVYPVRRLREPPPGFAALNPAFVRFTSGTTAAAKGVVLSHETIRDRVRAANEVLRVGPDDRVVWLLSMAYHFAVTVVGYLSHGAAVMLPANNFADAILAAARRHRGTLIYGSPAHYGWLAAAPAAGPLPELRLAVSTTAPLARETGERFLARFGVPVTQALGVIEVGLPFVNTDFAAERCDAVGRVLPAYELRLADAGLGDGSRLVALRGPGFFDAYYEPWRPRSEACPDGWFTTGDVAEVRPDGCVFLRGRVTDVINALGVKFFPQEVEAVLAAHPSVESACVSARPDPRLGEAVHAAVVLRPDSPDPPSAADLLDWCRPRLAAAKVPRWVEFVAALPRTASGKVLHRPAAAAPGGTP